jgi:nucleoside-diphosphate-sugar epimerase
MTAADTTTSRVGGDGLDPGVQVAVLGAGSFVARRLVPLLEATGFRPLTMSAREPSQATSTAEPLGGAIALCPVWGLVDRIGGLAERRVRRLVAISSTSRFTKANSSVAAERAVADRLAGAEDAVLREGERCGVRVTILRPTLLYDGLHDRNVATIAAFLRRWGWFPLLGAGAGLRQPLHADDLAAACVAALVAEAPAVAYDLSGGETLTYRAMVGRIFEAVGRAPRFVHVPRWVVGATVPWIARLPGFRGISVAMFERMNESLVFDHAAAARDLGFAPRRFLPSVSTGPGARDVSAGSDGS